MKRSSTSWGCLLRDATSPFRGRDAEEDRNAASSQWLNKLSCSAGSVSWYSLVARDIFGLLSRVFFAADLTGGFLLLPAVEDKAPGAGTEAACLLRLDTLVGYADDTLFTHRALTAVFCAAALYPQ